MWKIYLLAAISFLNGTSEYVIAGILDRIAEANNISISSAGQLITVFSVAFGAGTPFLIAMTARMDRKKLLVYALTVFSVINILIAIITGYEMLMAARIISALSAGVMQVTVLTLAAVLAAPGKQGSAIATVIMGQSTALVVGVPIGRVVASHYDWNVIFIGLGVVGLLFSALTLFTIPKTVAEETVPLREQFKFFMKPRITAYLLITFLWLGAYSVVFTYISPYFLDIFGMGNHGVTTALFIFGIASAIGAQLGGFSTDKWGSFRTLTGGMLLHAIALLLFPFIGQFAFLFYVLLIFWALSAWSSGSPIQFQLISLAPAAASIVLSLHSAFGQLGMAGGAGIGGIAVKNGLLNYLPWIGAFILVIAVVVTVVDNVLSKQK
ncbi:MFS transporter [Bacillus subtilis]|uniref:MFS transporter n=1 Tax=Bacillus TaxID=1386 RepID=UPI001E2B7DFA|nr:MULTISPECIES: MFS transporter [Bacillus]MCC8351011.1 MFS transporter [Bacillus sp. AF23]MEC1627802.1 MFS transporter [Bacillus mojavensis]MEC1671744.1 MFS transporter [Bacillus mojavensis]MEC1680123.1 MFS transporter [Bacillus mojavensis]MEC1686113.1 MFS transporter [Bacillus mojavensis]